MCHSLWDVSTTLLSVVQGSRHMRAREHCRSRDGEHSTPPSIRVHFLTAPLAARKRFVPKRAESALPMQFSFHMLAIRCRGFGISVLATSEYVYADRSLDSP